MKGVRGGRDEGSGRVSSGRMLVRLVSVDCSASVTGAATGADEGSQGPMSVMAASAEASEPAFG